MQLNFILKNIVKSKFTGFSVSSLLRLVFVKISFIITHSVSLKCFILGFKNFSTCAPLMRKKYFEFKIVLRFAEFWVNRWGHLMGFDKKELAGRGCSYKTPPTNNLIGSFINNSHKNIKNNLQIQFVSRFYRRFISFSLWNFFFIIYNCIFKFGRLSFSILFKLLNKNLGFFLSLHSIFYYNSNKIYSLFFFRKRVYRLSKIRIIGFSRFIGRFLKKSALTLHNIIFLIIFPKVQPQSPFSIKIILNQVRLLNKKFYFSKKVKNFLFLLFKTFINKPSTTVLDSWKNKIFRTLLVKFDNYKLSWYQPHFFSLHNSLKLYTLSFYFNWVVVQNFKFYCIINYSQFNIKNLFILKSSQLRRFGRFQLYFWAISQLPWLAIFTSSALRFFKINQNTNSIRLLCFSNGGFVRKNSFFKSVYPNSITMKSLYYYFYRTNSFKFKILVIEFFLIFLIFNFFEISSILNYSFLKNTASWSILQPSRSTVLLSPTFARKANSRFSCIRSVHIFKNGFEHFGYNFSKFALTQISTGASTFLYSNLNFEFFQFYSFSGIGEYFVKYSNFI